MSATRCLAFVLGTAIGAGAATASVVACKNGDYDGGSDAGPAAVDGTTVMRVVQPDKTETFASADGVFDVTFGAGTFAEPATITITSAGEQTLETGLIVPIYVVAADKEPAKFFQVSFHGNGNQSGNPNDRLLGPALQTAGAFKPLAMVGAPDIGGPNGTFWGLAKTVGTFSLVQIQSGQAAGFSDTATSCTAKCCGPMNGARIAGFPGGCFCVNGPDLACFLEHCAGLDAPAARCSAIAAGRSSGNVDCTPINVPNCPGPGCPGYNGTCGSAGTGGVLNTNDVCCIVNKNSGTCANGSCSGFAARCTASTPCPLNTKCCVFADESYCAADCPAAQRACASNADCTDAGADPDAGTCQGGGCPVGVCGTPPALCR